MEGAYRSRKRLKITSHDLALPILPAAIWFLRKSKTSLVDHHYFGIRNILALRGDPPMGEVDWQPRDGGYSYAYELIEQIKRMNQGSFIERPGFETTKNRQRTDFCIGCAVYPEHPDEEERFRFARLKFEAGAEYAISQMIFDPEIYGDFKVGLENHNIRSPNFTRRENICARKKQARVMQTRFRLPGSRLVFESTSRRTYQGP